MTIVRWTFTDPYDDSTYTFECNPYAGGIPAFSRNVSSVATCAPNGPRVFFEGRPQMQTITWDGYFYTEEMYNTLNAWYEKHHQIQLTDDNGVNRMIYITGFKAKRANAWRRPWKATYTMDALLVDVPS